MRRNTLEIKEYLHYLRESITILSEYSINRKYESLYNNEVFYNASIRRICIICRILLLMKQHFKDSLSEKDFIYFAELLKLFRNFTRFHYADVWYFVYKKLPDISYKLNRS